MRKREGLHGLPWRFWCGGARFGRDGFLARAFRSFPHFAMSAVVGAGSVGAVRTVGYGGGYPATYGAGLAAPVSYGAGFGGGSGLAAAALNC